MRAREEQLDSPDGHLALTFAAARPDGIAATLLTLLRQPRGALAILWARLTGRKLRARQALAALAGIDHRLALPPGSRPGLEPAAALAAHGIAIPASGRPLSADVDRSPLILLTAPGHDLLLGAAEAIASAFRDDPSCQALYGDALIGEEGGAIVPLLRPAFDPEYLRGIDYVGPVVALRRSCLAATGTDLVPGAEALDLLLRTDARFGSGAVRHLPRLLSASTPAGGSGASPAARLAALRADLARRGQAAARVAVEHGLLRVLRPMPEPRPLVSLIVPTRDRLDLLRPCLASLIEGTDWPDKEILVCDNDSREPDTLAYLRDLAERGIAQTIPCTGPFNFAAMNNAAAAQARGRVLAFVNNDVEAFRPDWLERMVPEALRPEIGAVGAKLLDGQGRIQHGGIVLGTGGLVTHGHRHFPGDAPGYLAALRATRRVSAVTAACLVVEAAKFRQVGGFDAARFAVDFNDVDLCLRLNSVGLQTLFVPGAVLHHREAASRRRTPASAARHRMEIAALEERWGSLLLQDPHYHPGFHPGLSTHARLRPGWTGLEPSRPR